MQHGTIKLKLLSKETKMCIFSCTTRLKKQTIVSETRTSFVTQLLPYVGGYPTNVGGCAYVTQTKPKGARFATEPFVSQLTPYNFHRSKY